MLLFILTSFFLPFKSFLVCICPVIPIPRPKATSMSNTLVHLNCLSCQQRPVQGKAQKHRGWGAEWEQRDCAQRHGMATIQHPSSLPAGHHPGWHRSDASSCPACPRLQLRMLGGEGCQAWTFRAWKRNGCGSSFLPGIRVFTLNQRLAK